MDLIATPLKLASQGTRARTSHFMQKVGPRNHGNVGRDQRAIEFFNCHKKGHVKADCWAKEGGRTKVRDAREEGQEE